MSRQECATFGDAQSYTWTRVSDGTPIAYTLVGSEDLDRRIETGRSDQILTLYAPSAPEGAQGEEMEQLDRKPLPPSESAQEWVESTLDVE